MNNIMVSYNANLNKAEIIINNLKNIGISTSDFESKINEIKNDIESYINDLTTIGYEQENSINSVYQNGIDKTNKILDDLKKYQKYYQTINECHYVQAPTVILALRPFWSFGVADITPPALFHCQASRLSSSCIRQTGIPLTGRLPGFESEPGARGRQVTCRSVRGTGAGAQHPASR